MGLSVPIRGDTCMNVCMVSLSLSVYIYMCIYMRTDPLIVVTCTPCIKSAAVLSSSSRNEAQTKWKAAAAAAHGGTGGTVSARLHHMSRARSTGAEIVRQSMYLLLCDYITNDAMCAALQA
eukprot:COSAG05_NODE_10549_length_559_cov_1.421739_1_plen_120_part_10